MFGSPRRLFLACLLVATALPAMSQGAARPRPSAIREAAPKDLEGLAGRRFVGAWELVGVSPRPLPDTDPRGLSRVKVAFLADGRYVALPHDGKVTPDLAFMAWDTTRIRLKLVAGKDSIQWCIPRFVGPDRMSLTLVYPNLGEEGGTFTYHRIQDPRGLDTPLEKRSLQEVQGSDPADALQAVPLARDAALPLAARLLGVWEVIAVRPLERSSRDLPPYGFLNDLWRFQGSSLDILVRQANTTALLAWKLQGNHLETTTDKGRTTEWSLQVDAWGHLMVEGAGARFELKHLTQDAARMPAVPLKVVLLER